MPHRPARDTRLSGALGHSLGLKVVAEGIEVREQGVKLQALGCEFGQGFFYSRPLTPDRFAEVFTNPSPEGAEEHLTTT